MTGHDPSQIRLSYDLVAQECTGCFHDEFAGKSPDRVSYSLASTRDLSRELNTVTV